MRKVFISDLHLLPNMCENSHVLQNFLLHEQIDELYILGDLFDYWIGDDVHLNEYHEIIQTFAKFNTPTSKTFMLYGNRDFLFGEDFFKLSKIQLISDPYYISYHNQKIMLTHGDLIFDTSITYQIFRRSCLWLNKHRFFKQAFLSLSKRLRTKIANKLRGNKNHYQHFELPDNVDVTKVMSNKNADIMIHGHTHVPTIQLIHYQNKYLKRYTLSDWHGKGCAVIIEYKQPTRMVYF